MRIQYLKPLCGPFTFSFILSLLLKEHSFNFYYNLDQHFKQIEMKPSLKMNCKPKDKHNKIDLN